MPEMVACFDQNGSLLPIGNTAQLPSAFLSNSLAKKALVTGNASDIVDAGGTVGPIYRYALVIPDPTGNGHIVVVMVGE